MKSLLLGLRAVPFSTCMLALMVLAFIHTPNIWYALLVLVWVGISWTEISEYRHVKEALTRDGWQPRIARTLQHSFPQRRLLVQAAREVGYAYAARAYLYAEGYRFWHVLPDFKGIRRQNETIRQYNLNNRT